MQGISDQLQATCPHPIDTLLVLLHLLLLRSLSQAFPGTSSCRVAADCRAGSALREPIWERRPWQSERTNSVVSRWSSLCCSSKTAVSRSTTMLPRRRCPCRQRYAPEMKAAK
ncbi:hypothetical protein JOH51_000993 [Rhizobium leguminosarum]|nr:hypothetical protein [Rhizobium leguminosarum]